MPACFPSGGFFQIVRTVAARAAPSRAARSKIPCNPLTACFSARPSPAR